MAWALHCSLMTPAVSWPPRRARTLACNGHVAGTRRNVLDNVPMPAAHRGAACCHARRRQRAALTLPEQLALLTAAGGAARPVIALALAYGGGHPCRRRISSWLAFVPTRPPQARRQELGIGLAVMPAAGGGCSFRWREAAARRGRARRLPCRCCARPPPLRPPAAAGTHAGCARR